MAGLTLVLGGVRSGKSDHALSLAAATGREVLFVATAQAADEEMRRRIARHREQRPSEWRTLEVSRDVAAAVAAELRAEVVLLDCLTLLISHLLHAADGLEDGAIEAAVEREIDELIDASRRRDWIVVSNEVGGGIVPSNRLARHFRDLQGRANQRLAAAADSVVLMVAGIPIQVKS